MTDFTKQVGWSPSVPAPQASITVATDNGDGTGYITNPDGTVITLCTECTVDTFATVSGSTVTDADGNSITVPAGSTYNAATNSITTSDGQVVALAAGTNVSAARLYWDTNTNRLGVGVTEDGNEVTGELQIRFADRDCGDEAVVIDSTTKELKRKPLRPERRTKNTRAFAFFATVTGAAVDALVDTQLIYISTTNTPFNNQRDCWANNKINANIRAGNWGVSIGNVGDRWKFDFTQPNSTIPNDMFSSPTNEVWNTANSGTMFFRWSQQSASATENRDNTSDYTQDLSVQFTPSVYTPHALNSVNGVSHVVEVYREEFLLEN